MQLGKSTTVFVFYIVLCLVSVQCQENVTSNNTITEQHIPEYLKMMKGLLQNSNFIQTIENQVEGFIKANNITLPPSIMSPQNLKNLLQLVNPGNKGSSGSINLQNIAKYAGSLGNINNKIRNMSEELTQQISPQCLGHLQLLVSKVTAMEPWAMQMIDATGKIPSSVIDGNFHWTGSYDECIGVQSGSFGGKYCTATLPLTSMLGSVMDSAVIESPLGVTVSMGICMPDGCTQPEIEVAVNALLGMLPLGDRTLSTSSLACNEAAEYDDLAIGGFVVCGVLIFLLGVATLFDVLYKSYQVKANEQEPHGQDTNPEAKYRVNGDRHKPTKARKPGILARLVVSFSIYTNGRKLFSTDQAGGALGSVNGIRFLSISWVVMGHVFSSSIPLLKNMSYYGDFLREWSTMPINNGLLSVDTFFTLSGLLVSYLFMREMKREKGRINWFMFYFHRFWRLTPVYMLTMFIEISLFRYLGDGPFWKSTGMENNFCRDTWWTNLLYVNNLVRVRDMCFGWSWYLANDMQFYVVSPLLLVPLYLSKKIGLGINILALLGITIATGCVAGHYDLLPTLITTDFTLLSPKFDHYFYDYYVVPWCRMGPYIVGIVTGYCLYRTNSTYHIPKLVNLLIWMAVTVVACLVVYGVHGPVTGHQWDTWVSALYLATHRTVWGACVCWVIFACVTGNGGFINDFLSWKLFVPLSRLSYSLYLVHLLVLEYYLQVLREPIYATNVVMIFLFLGTLVMSVLVSVVVSLAFEAPMMALEKVVFRRGRK